MENRLCSTFALDTRVVAIWSGGCSVRNAKKIPHTLINAFQSTI